MDCQSPDPVASEIAQRLLVLVERLRAHFELVAAEFGLTPTQAMALRFLGEPVPMGRLAELLHCERSNITLVVDRLAEREMVERQEDPTDRRVRQLVLTEAGYSLRERLEERLFQKVPEVISLDVEKREEFRELLRRLTPECEHNGDNGEEGATT